MLFLVSARMNPATVMVSVICAATQHQAAHLFISEKEVKDCVSERGKESVDGEVLMHVEVTPLKNTEVSYVIPQGVIEPDKEGAAVFDLKISVEYALVRSSGADALASSIFYSAHSVELKGEDFKPKNLVPAFELSEESKRKFMEKS